MPRTFTASLLAFLLLGPQAAAQTSGGFHRAPSPSVPRQPAPRPTPQAIPADPQPTGSIDPTRPPASLHPAWASLALLERWQVRLLDTRRTGSQGWTTIRLAVRRLDGQRGAVPSASTLHVRVLDEQGRPMPLQQLTDGAGAAFTLTLTVTGTANQRASLRPHSLLVYTGKVGVRWTLPR